MFTPKGWRDDERGTSPDRRLAPGRHASGSASDVGARDADGDLHETPADLPGPRAQAADPGTAPRGDGFPDRVRVCGNAVRNPKGRYPPEARAKERAPR